MCRGWLGVISYAVVFGPASAAQNGQVEVNDDRWSVTVRVDQDRLGRAGSGFSPRIATTIAARKILEFGCKLKPGVGQRVSGQVKGLAILSTKGTDEWAQVVVTAPVQSLKCKLEKLAAAEATFDELAPVQVPEPTVFREVKTDY